MGHPVYMHVLYGAAESNEGRLRSFRDDDDDEVVNVTSTFLQVAHLMQCKLRKRLNHSCNVITCRLIYEVESI